MLRAALRGAARGAAKASVPPPRILAVTALTSLGDADVEAMGFGPSAVQMTTRLAEMAIRAGVGGLVCSAREAAALRARFAGVFLCTPGIRPAGVAAGDQARVETPAAAIAAGSSLLVLGRALHDATDPAAAAKTIHDEVAAALG
jgi:orotidine-5'-phosphate decarboxylase